MNKILSIIAFAVLMVCAAQPAHAGIGYAPPGSTAWTLLQEVSTYSGAVATGSTIIPVDDTIPQSTEGDQYFSVAITPKYANSILTIEALINGTTGSSIMHFSCAIFRDAEANAIAAAHIRQPLDQTDNQLVMNYEVISGGTTTTTFKLRCGPSAAATFTLNGQGSARIFGGVFMSSLRVREYKQ